MLNVSSDRMQKLRIELESESNIVAVYRFGSSARGHATGVSDIDIGILFRSAVDEARYFDLRLKLLTYIMEILGTEKVDVVILNQATPHLAYEVVSHGNLLLDNNPQQRAAFEADRIGRFLDFKPFLAVQARAVKNHLLAGTYFD
jgi:uncharacterized protein